MVISRAIIRVTPFWVISRAIIRVTPFWVISRVIIRVTPFRALITLLITYLLSPLPLQVLGFNKGAPEQVGRTGVL